MDVSLIPVEVPLLGDERRKNWAKVVTAVDDSKASGWAFEGEFVATGGIQDVPVGAVLLVYGERGSRANPQIEAQVFIANNDGTLTPDAAARGRAWARTLRDPVAALLGDDRLPSVDLSYVSDTDLVEEARRRGLI